MVDIHYHYPFHMPTEPDEIAPRMATQDATPFEIGKSYFIRTVTYHVVGKVGRIVGKFIEFEKDTMSWVADSGRFTQAINNGNIAEVEPVSVIGGISMDAIVDYFEWIHPLLREQLEQEPEPEPDLEP